MKFSGASYSTVPCDSPDKFASDSTANSDLWASVWSLQALKKSSHNVECNNNNTMEGNRQNERCPLRGARRAVLQKSISVDSRVTSQRVLLLPQSENKAFYFPTKVPGEAPIIQQRSLECHLDKSNSNGTRIQVVKSASFDSSLKYRNQTGCQRSLSTRTFHALLSPIHDTKPKDKQPEIIFNGTYPIDEPIEQSTYSVVSSNPRRFTK